MTTLVDGLGYEELGDSGDTGSKVSQLWLTGSVTSQSNLQAAGNISGATNIYGQNVYNESGALTTVFLESGAYTRATQAYGGKIKVGNLTTSAASGATIVFVDPFAAGSYAIFFSPAAVSADPAVPAFTSGALRASGCAVIGAASISYNWLAVGA